MLYSNQFYRSQTATLPLAVNALAVTQHMKTRIQRTVILILFLAITVSCTSAEAATPTLDDLRICL